MKEITEQEARKALESLTEIVMSEKQGDAVDRLSTLITRHFEMEKAVKEIASYSNIGVFTYNTSRLMSDIAQQALTGKGEGK